MRGGIAACLSRLVAATSRRSRAFPTAVVRLYRSTMTRLARFEWLARSGYIARGAVYLLVGWFSLAAAWSGARPTDAQDALLRILDQPFGELLLA